MTARVSTGRLWVRRSACPNLLAEAKLYRYPDEPSEAPIDAHNHALAALRYLVSKLDERFVVQFRRQAS